MTPALQQFRAQLQENSRLRMGCWIILLILVLYLIMILQDKNRELHSQFSQYGGELLRLEKVADGKKWRQRAQSEMNAWTDELKHFPLIESQGMAIAGIENKIRAILPTVGAATPRLNIEPFRAITNIPGIMQLTVNIDGSYTHKYFVQLLYDIEKMDQRGKITSLHITRNRIPRFSLTYVYYFQTQ